MKKRFFTRPITIVVSESMYQQLTKLTQENDYSLSQWIRDAISLRFINPIENFDKSGDD